MNKFIVFTLLLSVGMMQASSSADQVSNICDISGLKPAIVLKTLFSEAHVPSLDDCIINDPQFKSFAGYKLSDTLTDDEALDALQAGRLQMLRGRSVYVYLSPESTGFDAKIYNDWQQSQSTKDHQLCTAQQIVSYLKKIKSQSVPAAQTNILVEKSK
ncbi:MAG: hypothetical protein P4L31_03105 [Candidatus Babeliales bacterium]|nr:hypothetical protein [Candidatus Babeliales bacterium]